MDRIDAFNKINDMLKEAQEDTERGVLEEQEIQALILAFATTRGEEGFTEDEVVQLVRWAEEIRIGSTLLDLVFGGYASVNIIDGEPYFGTTEKGRRAVKENTNGPFN